MAENVEPIKQLFDDLFGLLETLETQSMAVMELLKAEGIGTEEKLKPYLERAGNASSVKWRAARARMEYLLAPAKKDSTEAEKEKKKEADKQSGGTEAEGMQTPEKSVGEKHHQAGNEQGEQWSDDPKNSGNEGQGPAAKARSEQPSGNKGNTDKSIAEGTPTTREKDGGQTGGSLQSSDTGRAAKK